MRARTTNDLCTPPHILDRVRSIAPIILDPCSNPWSSVGAAISLDGSTPALDGLAADWLALSGYGLTWVNCPYGRGHMRKWSDKIVAEAKAGCEIVALVKCDPSTAWWARLRREVVAIAYLDERVEFVGGDHKATFPSAALYFGTRPFRFAEGFAGIADVRVLR